MLVGIKTPAQADEDASIGWALAPGEREWLTDAHPGVPEVQIPPRHAAVQT